MQLRNCASAIVLTISVFVFADRASAQSVPAITFTPPVSFSGAGVGFATYGYAFDVTAAAGVSVTHLSVFNSSPDGLLIAHDVAIWNSAGTMLASGTVPGAKAAPLDATGLFRYVDIPDVTLPQGTGYAVGALNHPGGDGSASTWTNLVVAPGITYIEPRYFNNSVPTISMPLPTVGSAGFVGGSFLVAPVPDPTGAALLPALLLLSFCRRGTAFRLPHRDQCRSIPYRSRGRGRETPGSFRRNSYPNSNTITRRNLDGTNPEAVLTLGATEQPFGMELFAGRMYWRDNDNGLLRSATINGTDVKTVLSGLDSPRAVSVLNVPEPTGFSAHIFTILAAILGLRGKRSTEARGC